MQTLTRDELAGTTLRLRKDGMMERRFPNGSSAVFMRGVGWVPTIEGGSPAIASRAPGQAAEEPAAPGTEVPFVRASVDYVEQFFQDAVTPGAGASDRGPHNVTPGGFLRGVRLHVTGAGGSLGPATLAADYPFSALSYVVLEDIGGSPIFGPLTGYETYLVNKYGGYFFHGDPSTEAGYVGTIDADFFLFIPTEFRSDALGSLANTDARAQYRFRYGVAAALANTGSTAWTTPPNLTITGYVETWAQVERTSLEGSPQEFEPPGLGTTQYWIHESPVVAAAASTVRLNRVGNLIRNLIFLTRKDDAQAATLQATPRADSFDNPIRIRLDNRYLRVDTVRRWRSEMNRKYGLTTFGQTRDTGVLVLPYAEGADTHPSPGEESNYLTTTEASYFAIEATFNEAGTLNMIVNDIAPYGDFPMPDQLG